MYIITDALHYLIHLHYLAAAAASSGLILIFLGRYQSQTWVVMDDF